MALKGDCEAGLREDKIEEVFSCGSVDSVRDIGLRIYCSQLLFPVYS